MTPEWKGRVSVAHFIGGVNNGKTLAAVIKAWIFAGKHPNGAGVWTVPFGRDKEKSFWQTVRTFAPPGTWVSRKDGSECHLWNGFRIDITTRHSSSGAERKAGMHGAAYLFAIHDELALDKNPHNWTRFMERIRGNEAGYKFIATMSNPIMGWYRDLLESDPEALILVGKTSENKYGGVEMDAFLRKRMSLQEAQARLDGLWVSQGDRLYEGWSDAVYPEGNRHPMRWNPALPWQLWLDPGVRRSAWLIVQQVRDPYNAGETIDVVVGEYIDKAQNKGARQVATQIREDIDRETGRANPPVAIVYDPAAKQRSQADSTNSVRRELQQVWGMFPQYREPKVVNKEIQLGMVQARVQNGLGHRRLTASTELISDGVVVSLKGKDRSPSGRGVLEVMREASVPKIETAGDLITTKSLDEQLSDGRLEHAHDAIMYGVAVNHPLYARQTHGTDWS